MDAGIAGVGPEWLDEGGPDPLSPQGDVARTREYALAGALAAIFVAGAVLRLLTLGTQSFHHDEVVTAARVIPGSFGHTLHEINVSESTPPLYYVLAWGWTRVFGDTEVGLRSMSVLFGLALIPVAYLIGNELNRRRAGLILAAMVAVNPMMIWYSQEARSYSLMVLFSAAAFWFFLRALRIRDRRDVWGWAACSVLAFYSHYFSIFPMLIEAAWLIGVPGIRRKVLPAFGVIGILGLALAPLAIAQGSHAANIDWFTNVALPTRIGDTGVTFMIGETGHVIAQAPDSAYAILPGALIVASILLLAVRGDRQQRRAGLIAGSVVAGAVLIPILGALLGKDYIIERNLFAGLVPLLAVAAVGFSIERARKAGIVLASALILGWAAFSVLVISSPDLQRPDWNGAAIDMGSPTVPTATVTWRLGMDPLAFYLRDGGETTKAKHVVVKDIDVIAIDGAHPDPRHIPFPFSLDGSSTHGNLTTWKYSSPVPAQLSTRQLESMDSGFDDNGLYLDGPRYLAVPPL